jgi:gamma-glutamyltranspeptidase
MFLPSRNYRPLIMGRNGAVGSNSPMATQAGLDMLRSGGNAADAAAAISLALGVCEPGMSGLGADGFIHIYDTSTRASTVYNGTGPAAKSANAEEFRSGVPFWGPLSISVPGILGALWEMHAAHGKLAWDKVVAPAIVLAKEGFAVTHSYCRIIDPVQGRLREDSRSKDVYMGKSLGDIVICADLARTLEEIAEDGADTFYRGAIAKRLAKSFAEIGALLTEGDLAEYYPEVTVPISAYYRGYEIRQTPPNSTGFTMLEILKIAENFDMASLSLADQIHVLVEAKKLAFVDRDRYSQDPRFGEVPLEEILSDEYTRNQAGKIDLKRAAVRPISRERTNGDTTYYGVIDCDGNAVSGIQSNATAFGSGVTAGDTGILMNNRMAWWDNDPNHPNSMAPGKRTSHTMNAPMVFFNDDLWCVFGTPGADNQVQINAQALSAMVDFEMDPQTVAERPRWSNSQIGQGEDWNRDLKGCLTVEESFSPEILNELERRGHLLHRVPPLGGPCSLQAIRVLENGVRAAGSDPRRDGWAAAY